MELLLSFVIQIFGELIVQLLFEIGFSGLAAPFSNYRRAHPAFSVCVFFLFGLAAGGASLWIAPYHLTPNLPLRIANLMLTPVLIGAGMNLLGNVRERKELFRFRPDQFSCGFCFALGMAAVRFIWAR